MQFFRNHAALLFGVLGGGLIAAYLLVRTIPLAESIVYEATSLLALFAVVVGLRWRLRRRSGPWRVFTIGVAVYALGDAMWCLHDVLGVQFPVSHVSDTIYLLSYPLFAWALIGFSASRREPLESILRQLVDAALLFASAYSAVWFLLLDPIFDRGGKPLSELVLAVLYPTLDLALLALVARFAFSAGRWPLSYCLMTGAFTAPVRRRHHLAGAAGGRRLRRQLLDQHPVHGRLHHLGHGGAPRVGCADRAVRRSSGGGEAGARLAPPRRARCCGARARAGAVCVALADRRLHATSRSSEL